jgi:hypothetical protein
VCVCMLVCVCVCVCVCAVLRNRSESNEHKTTHVGDCQKARVQAESCGPHQVWPRCRQEDASHVGYIFAERTTHPNRQTRTRTPVSPCVHVLYKFCLELPQLYEETFFRMVNHDAPNNSNSEESFMEMLQPQPSLDQKHVRDSPKHVECTQKMHTPVQVGLLTEHDAMPVGRDR